MNIDHISEKELKGAIAERTMALNIEYFIKRIASNLMILSICLFFSPIEHIPTWIFTISSIVFFIISYIMKITIEYAINDLITLNVKYILLTEHGK